MKVSKYTKIIFEGEDSEDDGDINGKKEQETNDELLEYYYVSNGMMFEYFVGYEIAALLGYKNTTQVIVNSVSKSNQLIFKDYPGTKIPFLDPRTILITRDGAVEILLKTRKRISPDVAHILKKFNIETTNKKCLTKEQQTLSSITDAFKTEKYEDQYKVGNYFLDLYFPDYKLVIECDENGHSDRKPGDERSRMDYINKELKIDDSYWIRFNPDEHNFDVMKVVSKIHNKIKEKSVSLVQVDNREEIQRTCNRCFLKKNLEKDFSSTGIGYYVTCKDCKSCIRKEKYELKYNLIINDDSVRKCISCKEEKNLSPENFKLQGESGFSLICRACKVLTGNNKSVVQYKLDGTFIREYPSLKEASYTTNINVGQISQNCREVVKTAGGYMWKFSVNLNRNNIDKKFSIAPVKNDVCKTVAQYSKSGELLKTFISVGEACRVLKLKNPRSVYSAIKNNFVSYGFVWRYVDGDIAPQNIPEVTEHRKYMKPVELYKNGMLIKTFKCMKDACIDTKHTRTTCIKFLSGEKKDPSGLEWKFKKL